MASLGPEALRAAQAPCVMLAFGASLARPRELYRLRFIDAGTGLPAVISPASGSGTVDTTPRAEQHDAAAVADTAAVTAAPMPAGLQALRAARCQLPERNPAADACAALSEREQRAVRRALRSLVVAQPSVPAWAQALREWHVRLQHGV